MKTSHESQSLSRRPALYIALVIAAGLLNLAGYFFTLWHQQTPFDEAVHFYTSFAGTAALAFLVSGRWRFTSPAPRPWACAAVGLALGLVWEGIELVGGFVGGRIDTILDLILDTCGAAAAALLVHAGKD